LALGIYGVEEARGHATVAMVRAKLRAEAELEVSREPVEPAPAELRSVVVAGGTPPSPQRVPDSRRLLGRVEVCARGAREVAS